MKYLYFAGISEYSGVADKETLFAERVEAIIERRQFCVHDASVPGRRATVVNDE
jgi:hypothetical protein